MQSSNTPDKIIILTSENKFFGQTRKPWVSIDIEKFTQKLGACGIYSYSDIVNRNIEVENAFIVYTFSQKNNQRNYIQDTLLLLSGKNVLLPSYDLLLCHENKGYQELFRKQHGIKSLNAYYFSSIEELNNYTVTYPCVLKTTDGSNAKGVYLIEDENQLIKILTRFNRISILNKIDLFRRKYFRKNKIYKEYPYYSNTADYYEYGSYIKGTKRFVLQDYIPDLHYDFRVLIFYNKYFVTKRLNRKGDFRASGAKIFDFNIQADHALLNFARSLFDKFDTPILALDIAYDGSAYHLLEFQASHFGISTLISGKKYYVFENNNWKVCLERDSIEVEYADAVLNYLNAKYGF
ncbi:MAG: hypothetical protein JW995_07025 [Melioribacteraceae bacterium]|nr:hypothetical protein [Melioribacteraceae bacterium]